MYLNNDNVVNLSCIAELELGWFKCANLKQIYGYTP